MSCPCGSGQSEAACCGPWIAGAPAPTAVALMRSRYTGYVRGEIEYLLATQHASTRSGGDREAVARWSHETQWQGLEIVATERGGEGDDEGIVEFIARGVTRGTPFAQHERSRFRREGGHWFYVAGVVAAPPARRVATAGRNDPCPCGSGMKYKRCHGA